MNYVIKIKYEDTLRRLTYHGNRPHGDQAGDKLTYAKLEAKIRDLFNLPENLQIRVTYTDKDNDVVTMGDDQDLEDACVLQGLNPLRLTVTVPKAVSPQGQTDQPSPLKGNKEAVPNLKQMLKGLPADVMKPVVDHVQQLLKGSAASPRQLSELVDTVVNTVISQIDSAKRKVDASANAFVTEIQTGPSELSATSHHHPGFGPGFPERHENAPIPTPPKVGAGTPVVNRDVNDTESAEAGNACRVFHTGVQCDVCGISPIVGPRFKSSKKHDYDLCLSCFKDFGNASDYTRIDRPLFRPRHLATAGNARMRCPAFNPNFHTGRPFAMRGPYGGRPDSRCQAMHQMNGSGGKLDARFVQDVTIFDGTELAPGTNFTKIWRLRNSGTLPWPLDTKLVHVGGDELGCVFIVPLELPERGLAPGEEVEASVDLVAPEKPGRYVSHWRLASPSGPKFGHRVWVLIQVVSKEEHEDAVINEMSSPSPSETGITESTMPNELQTTEMMGNTLFLSKEYPSGLSSLLTDSDVSALGIGKEVSDELTGPVVDTTPQTGTVHEGFEGLKSTSGSTKDDLNTVEDDAIFGTESSEPKNDLPLDFSQSSKDENVKQAVVGEGSPSKTSESIGKEKMPVHDVSSYVNSELGGFSMVEMPQLINSSSSSMTSSVGPVEPQLPSPRKMELSVEERLLVSKRPLVNKSKTVSAAADLCDKLEGMGFNDRKLNLELLEKNNMDLRLTLDDLVGAADWDPILEELEEMGFYDVEMNRRLMFKNNGSVKRVVKELVQMYREPVSGGKDQDVA